MTNISFMKTTDYRLNNHTETWNIALGESDYTPMTCDDLKRLRCMIDDVLNESQKGCVR